MKNSKFLILALAIACGDKEEPQVEEATQQEEQVIEVQEEDEKTSEEESSEVQGSYLNLNQKEVVKTIHKMSVETESLNTEDLEENVFEIVE